MQNCSGVVPMGKSEGHRSAGERRLLCRSLPAPSRRSAIVVDAGYRAMCCRLHLLALQVVQDIEAAQQAVQAASDVDAATIAAEDLRHQAATAISDVARMLRAEGPAAAIAEVRCAVIPRGRCVDTTGGALHANLALAQQVETATVAVPAGLRRALPHSITGHIAAL